LALGVLLLVMIAIVYLGASYYRVRPAGHPATAVFWFVIGFIILRTALRPQRVPQWFYYVWAGLVIVGMILWLLTTAELIAGDRAWRIEGGEWLNRVC
jgi:hypothetical protein